MLKTRWVKGGVGVIVAPLLVVAVAAASGSGEPEARAQSRTLVAARSRPLVAAQAVLATECAGDRVLVGSVGAEPFQLYAQSEPQRTGALEVSGWAWGRFATFGSRPASAPTASGQGAEIYGNAASGIIALRVREESQTDDDPMYTRISGFLGWPSMSLSLTPEPLTAKRREPRVSINGFVDRLQVLLTWWGGDGQSDRLTGWIGPLSVSLSGEPWQVQRGGYETRELQGQVGREFAQFALSRCIDWKHEAWSRSLVNSRLMLTLSLLTNLSGNSPW